MSGGSYEYLCFKEVDQLFGDHHELKSMYERLQGLDYAQDAAKETLNLVLTIQQYEVLAEVMKSRLENVWRAVEWWDSGDSGEEDVKAALDDYRKPSGK